MVKEAEESLFSLECDLNVFFNSNLTIVNSGLN